MTLNRNRARQLLADFDFQSLFVGEMGWNSVPDARPLPIDNTGYLRRLIAEMSGVAVLEVFPDAPDGALPDRKASVKVHSQIAQLSHENVIIFLDDDRARSKSMLYWVKREDGKTRPRRHHYFKGQPGDLFMSKIDGMVIEMDELREDGSLPISAVTNRLAAALDIERVTKRFYERFRDLRVEFIELIEGIEKREDREWYASALLNRLMFIYFLQKKGFIQNNSNYLDVKLRESQSRGRDRFYSEFLEALFFEGFAKPEHERNAEANSLLGPIPYLNGGLFLKHRLEDAYQRRIFIPDKAFENVLRLFSRYSWHLNDTPGARDNEINPDVLGYIFEKYINQKAFGAYYTRAEITEYLCERSIHSVILQKVNANSVRQFDNLNDVLMRLDAPLCRTLLYEVLPKLSILDPACGSGAFLVAAMKNLLDIYGAVYGRIEVLNDRFLLEHKREITNKHPSLNYYIRKQIIVDNLYGVDIMDEATEIARLRLFLALVGAAMSLADLEPLPNIDFNIMAGNSLIGLLSVDDARFDESAQTQDMLQRVKARDYRRALAEKNRLIALYRDTTSMLGPNPHPQTPSPIKREGANADANGLAPRSPSPLWDARHRDDGNGAGGWGASLQSLRDRINEQRETAQGILNDILLDDFRALKIQYEQAQLKGKPVKRPLETADIEALTPFHWGYEFDEIIETRGGFDVIITNPPWQDVKIVEKTFFQQFDSTITKNKTDKRELRQRMAELLQSPSICSRWLAYQGEVSLNKAYFKKSALFASQRKGKLNLYALFIEQCKNLLRNGGACGIVVPDGIYSLKGRQLMRQMLFEETEITGLFGFENRKAIFEGVDSRFKFVVLSFKKGGKTEAFPAAFMRHDVAELEGFPDEESLRISIDLIRRTSPNTLSITEFKTSKDIEILEKMLNQPLLGEGDSNTWYTTFRYEFDQGKVSSILQGEASEKSLPYYKGEMIWQFQSAYADATYFIDEGQGRRQLMGRQQDRSQYLDYQYYRLGFRDIARSTDTRTWIATVLPPKVFAAFTIPVINLKKSVAITDEIQLYLCAAMNSFVLDYSMRQRIGTHVSTYYVNQTPVPRLTPADPYFDAIVRRAAQLICTAPAFDELAAEVGLGDHRNGVTDPAERARLRAELDGMIAHVYGLSEDEFAYVLGTFPLVAGSVKAAALAAYRAVARGDSA